MDIKNKMIKNLDRVINEYVEKESIPGLAVGVVYDNEILYTKGFGVKNVDTKEPVDENSIFHMASVSKTFVATGIMQLVEKGKIKLDSHLTEYLPYFQLKDDRYKNITIRQLLSHMSGMPDVDDYGWDNPQYDEDALEKYIKSIKNEELMWEPGEKFAYSNIAFEILGDVIAKVSGVTFEEYMKVNILEVLQMKESDFFNPNVSKELLATPHILGVKNGYGGVVSEVFPYNRAHGPSSTLCSNVREMCNYAIANMNGGCFGEEKILETHSYSELWHNHGSTGWGGYTSEVGLAWFLGEYKGNKVRSHSGLDTGFRSNFIILPERGISVVIMTNSDYIGLKLICTAILDILLGEEVQYVKQSLAHYMAKKLFDNNFEATLKEYSSIKEDFPDRYNFIEDEFKFVAYELVERGKLKKAIEVMKISTEISPESSNLYYNLGKMYLLNGDKKLALESYKKSMELDPDNIKVKKKVEELIKEI